MKTTKKIVTMLALVIAFIAFGTNSAKAQSWTYKATYNNVIHKVHFENANGHMTIQLYDNKSNKWSYCPIISQQANSGNDGKGTTYYKIKDGVGTIWEIWAKSNGTLEVKGSGSTLTYYKE